MKSGLTKIWPSAKDYSLLHTFGDVAPSPSSLPASFSVYDSRPIPNQDLPDDRFTPPLMPLFYGCTAESLTFDSGIQDAALYNPLGFYVSTPPHTMGDGRDIRTAMQTAIDVGFQGVDGHVGAQRTAYFTCYGVGAIDDFDAARIGLYINQNEKRSVIIGSYWYWGEYDGIDLSEPSYNTSQATLHCYIATGWQGDNLEIIAWTGKKYLMSRAVFNKLMAQPYTGAFTMTKTQGISPLPIGAQAWIDHIVYFVRNLFHV